MRQKCGLIALFGLLFIVFACTDPSQNSATGTRADAVHQNPGKHLGACRGKHHAHHHPLNPHHPNHPQHPPFDCNEDAGAPGMDAGSADAGSPAVDAGVDAGPPEPPLVSPGYWPQHGNGPLQQARSAYDGPTTLDIFGQVSLPGFAEGALVIDADGNLYVPSGDFPSSVGYLTSFDSDLNQRWQFVADNDLRGSPALSDGIVHFGTFDNTLYALDVDDGSLLWSRTMPSYPGNPTVAKNVLYVVSGGLFAIDPVTGADLWTYPDSTLVFSGNPAVTADDVLYMGTGDGRLLALDTTTQTLLWTYTAPSTTLTLTEPTVDDEGNVYVGTFHVAGGETMYLISVDADGNERWKFASNASYDFVGRPSVTADGVVLAGDGLGMIRAFDKDTGTLLWDDTFGGDRTYSEIMVATNGVGYVGQAPGLHVAFDIADGALRWSHFNGNNFSQDSSTPVIGVGGRMYFAGALVSTLYGLNPDP